MAYIITGTATFSSQSNRDAALTRLNDAIASYSLTSRTTVGFPAGIGTPDTTTITVSFEGGTDDANAAAISNAIYDAWVSKNRQTRGYLSVSKI